MRDGSGGTKSPVGEGTESWKATRRGVLAAGGAVALGGLAGCTTLDRVVDRASDQVVQNRTASPAAFYAGAESLDSPGDLYRSGPVDVRFVPPELQAEGQRIEIEGWSTSTTTKAQDYNSSRSNRPRTIWVPDHLDDDDGDGIPTLAAALDAERALVVYHDAALDAVDERASEGINDPFDGFTKISGIARETLDGCGTDRCRTVAENLAGQREVVADARAAVDAGEWDSAGQSLRQARRIAQSDIDGILDDLDSDDDGILDAAASRFDNLEIRGRSATVAEHFVVSLPDARVRGGGPALADELTPERVVDYFLGETDAERCDELDGTVVVHRDLACRDLLTARLDESRAKHRQVAAFELSGSVVVTGATAAADAAAPMWFVAPDNTASPVESLDTWGAEATSGEASVSSTLVCPAVATTPECSCPMPVLFHVRRIRHDGQLLFVGGWTIDDGALYENSATLLTADGPNHVASVVLSDGGNGSGDIEYQDGDDLLLRKRPGRTKYANITLRTPYDPEDDHLPAGSLPACRRDGEVYCWGVQSMEALAKNDTGSCPGADGDTPTLSVATALDTPVVHLVDAADASNDVKFKAGAELSKSAN